MHGLLGKVLRISRETIKNFAEKSSARFKSLREKCTKRTPPNIKGIAGKNRFTEIIYVTGSIVIVVLFYLYPSSMQHRSLCNNC